MKNEGVPVVKEGLPFIIVLLLATVGFGAAGWWPLTVLFFILTAFTAFFFRNPERLQPVGKHMVASPADGTILSVETVTEPEFLNEEMQRVCIFLSVFNVHVNRVPIDGTVKDIRYHRGRFMAAFEERASEENERNHVLIEGVDGEKVVVVQVAGLIARRIICYPTIGMFIMKGQRMGLIRFGSRTDVYLPKSAEVLVKKGDRVLGCETVIAKLKENSNQTSQEKGDV